ncbi:hypothetical protein [Aliiruegeria lutimaris]|uniref:O-antigen ligase n=1 Tax=Aliiruegeria lutimaris TaxID=571298 RepID=A0A1G9FTQ9_9RHOB|nr:hypothetical protein [Aliiruegeria lutimaris]SDK91799.1 hypothetical protein SAMN04488026_105920 [Aliiruegeria lutimaris]
MTRVRRFSTPVTELPVGQLAGAVAEGRELPAQRRHGAARAAGILAAIAVALSPMNYLRMQGIYVTASDAAMILAFILLLVNHRLPLHFFGSATGFWFVCFLLFCGGLTLGSLVNGEPKALPSVYAQYFFSLVVLPMVLAGRSYPEVVALIKVLVAALVGVMLFGIYVFHFVDDPSTRLVSGSGRMRSLIERENECAALAGIGMVFVLGLNFLGHLRRGWLVISLPVLGYGVLLTGSNSGLIVSLLGVSTIVLFCGSARHVLLTCGLILACGASALLFGEMFLPEVFQERVLNALLTHDVSVAGTFEDRAQLLGEAMHTARGTLMIGLGVDQYREISAFGAPVHNVYLLVLTEGGAMLLFGLVGLLLTGVFVAVQAIRADHSRKVGALTLTVLLIFALMLYMFPTFYARFWNVPVILAIALSASRLMEVHDAPKQDRRTTSLGEKPFWRMER